MTYEVEFEDPAWDFLQALSDKDRLAFEKKIEALETNPFPNGHIKLRGETAGGQPVYRIRKGNYRILYTVENNILLVVVVTIDNRSDVYKSKK